MRRPGESAAVLGNVPNLQPSRENIGNASVPSKLAEAVALALLQRVPQLTQLHVQDRGGSAREAVGIKSEGKAENAADDLTSPWWRKE